MLLVTGITGHTGRYFLQELINHKYEGPIRCIVRETSNTSLLEKSGLNIEKIIGDLNDPEFIDKVMDGVNTVMHIYNIHHSPMIVQSAIKKKVKRTILVHTTGIYSEFKYASEGYKKIEQKINELNNDPECLTNITILRPSMIYGDLCDRNMSKFIKMVDKIRILPIISGGNSLIQPVNARDLGKAFFTVLISPQETAGKAYDLSGERPIKMIDVFKLISKELNKKTIFISVPLSLGVLMAKILKFLTLGRIDFIEKVQRMGENRSYSHDNATNDFGYSPMTFEKGIQIEVQEYLEENRN
ncbi:NmrA family NAD(P)-binding protein [Domibacillus sp. DTU_2020_1001157_1_SI_ALB_TIR_016]|uniref:SDR family oxidoreductase n=1 Tax=Domibacillus sp. DTU_2020_1001157_1_SI_ALB_TIR_016 TaxID=3077789 RepID=UPI0028E8330D|nr:NmrA family NAD(P)-binding protein [Domibacillus sp. DTU_2020_1001157_1_SI_ALB_TIR_016]WNS81179.1 NmrA family NAD(P)-binding protein [Domibacillus sp. DTU_2020_1001157_1_SI_ALB_TIR_016]